MRPMILVDGCHTHSPPPVTNIIRLEALDAPSPSGTAAESTATAVYV
jgi:hypothetical protein